MGADVYASMLPERNRENMPSSQRRRWHDVDKSEIPVETLIRSFLMYQGDQNHSPKTVEWYTEMLGRFNRFLGEKTQLRDINIAAVVGT